MAQFSTIKVLLVSTLLANHFLFLIPVPELNEQPGLSSEGASWTYADLRLLDPSDAPLPTQDIIATYIRSIHEGDGFERLFNLWHKHLPQETQIRLDFLDLDVQSAADVYLAIDHQPGGTPTLPWGNQAQIHWDTLIVLPAFGAIQAWDFQQQAIQNLSIRIVRDPVLDTFVITLDTSKLPGATARFSLQVFTTGPGSEKVVDQTKPFSLNDIPPEPAPVLFAFWNTLPAYTPALALRRWDGAHTGPLGGRHGLYNLLRAARNNQIPLALLDLKSTVSLSALDYVEGVPIVQRMAAEGLLILPDHVPQIGLLHEMSADFSSLAASTSRQVSLAFRLPASPFVYAALDDSLRGSYPVVMTNLASPKTGAELAQGMETLFRWRDKTVIAIPNEVLPEQVTQDGLSLQTRKALVLTAIANETKPALGEAYILVLGGDLPNSEWGVPQYARAGFRYLRLHPWIRPLDAQDLIGARPVTRLAQPQLEGVLPSSTLNDNPDIFLSQFVDQLFQLPQTSLTQAAWLSLLSLYSPLSPHPTELDTLRSIYAGQLGLLMHAARWAADPKAISSCANDLDLDGTADCLLTSENVFAAFKTDTGVLTHLFIRTPSGFHQVIAPSSQFVVGLSEASSWNLDKGLNADPTVIPGAFSIETEGSEPVKAIPSADHLSLTGNGIEITYQTAANGLTIEFRADHPISTQLPLALDPWTRYTPAWGERYVWIETAQDWVWEIDSGPSIHIHTNAQLTPSLFNETRKKMAQMENPNFEFPASHFLPFPIALLTLEAPGDFFVEISLTD